jgi:hypothetical protein
MPRDTAAELFLPKSGFEVALRNSLPCPACADVVVLLGLVTDWLVKNV